MSGEVVLTISTRPQWKQWQFGVYDVRDIRITKQARRLIEHDLRRFRIDSITATAQAPSGDTLTIRAERRVTYSSELTELRALSRASAS